MKQTYDPHPGVAMMRNWIDTLPAKTGRNVAEWIAFVNENGPAGRKERIAWLKETQQLGTNTATWIADAANGSDDLEDGDPDKYVARAAEYVEAMFAGPKAALRPIYDALYDLARALGDDVRISPAKTLVSIAREHVIAQIKPATRTRIDFGLALGNTPIEGRMIDTGGFEKKDRITRKFELTSVKDIDAEVKRWLRKAYEGR